MKDIKYIISFLFSVIVFLVPTIKIAKAQTYYKPVPSLPITFDPKHYHDAYSILVAAQIYDRLFDVDEFANLKPKLAYSWTNKDNGKTWTINIRTDVFFHNGKQLTANDVKFSLSRLVKKDSLKQYELLIIQGAKEYCDGKTKDIVGIKVLSPSSLEITLTHSFTPFLATFAAPNTEIIPENYGGESEESFFDTPVGTGPFKLDKYEKGKLVQLTANEKYFLGKPKINLVIFEKADSVQAFKGFNNGHFHDVEFYYASQSDINRDFTFLKSPEASTSIIAFNLKRPPFDNIHIRKAIEAAIDKESLYNKCFSQHILANSFIPPGLGGYNPDVFKTPYDLKIALKEMQIAKIPKEILAKQYTLIRPDNHPCRKEFKELIGVSLKKIGLNINVVYLPFDEIASKYLESKNFDIYNITLTADFPEALFMLNSFRSNYPYNLGGVVSPEFDSALDIASNTSDKFERYRFYQKAQELLRDIAGIIPIYHCMAMGVFQTNVRGVERNPLTSYLSPMNTIYFASHAEQ